MRTIQLLMSLCLIWSSVSGQQADCPDNMQLIIETPTQVNRGQFVEIPVSANGFTDVQGFELSLTYNPTVLSLVDVLNGPMIDRIAWHAEFPGIVRCLYLVFNNPGTLSLNDGEVIMFLRFEVVGDIGKDLSVGVSDVYTQEVVMGDIDTPCVYEYVDADITHQAIVGCNDPSLAYSVCKVGADIADLKVRVCGVTLPISYTISSEGTPVYQGVSTMEGFSLENVAPGVYWIEVIDADGLALLQRDVIVSDEYVPMSISIDASSPVCNNDPISLTIGIDGDVAYPAIVQFNNQYALIEDGENFIFDGLTDTEYSIIIQDANGCASERSLVVDKTPKLRATVRVANASCSFTAGIVVIEPFGGTPFAGGTYLFNGVQKDRDTIKLSPGNYTALVVDKLGCVLLVPIEVGKEDCVDVDNDGYGSDIDCDDSNPSINPGAAEVENSGFDENCDGVSVIIDEDGDGWNSSIDCDDTNAEINGNAEEIPDNGVDEDCDGVDEMTSSTYDLDGQVVHIYPNPVEDKLYIEGAGASSKFQIFGIAGKLLGEYNPEQEIDLSNFRSGVYLFIVQHSVSNQYIIHKFIKK